MGNVRTSALMNGVGIGCALGAFGVGLVVRFINYALAKEYSEKWLVATPNDTELLMHIEYLKASGNQVLLVCIIIGIILLAVGIGSEVYERAKRKNS